MLAMTGDTSGEGTENDYYGVYFEPTGYTLFKGDVYPAPSGDFPVILDNANLIITNTFPGSMVVFTRGSGEIVDYSNPQLDKYSVTITDSLTGATRVIKLNKYGATTN